ncbi:hypothetical protein BUALT_Bualt06G0009800 [Buddleja alternifolia]|uniref:CHHC U11-48K-type domain-containing protein n=1 Tax=Buddleja alternifolia TaxID=168488 RepID=A0AAV6XBZ9_9LAMI|nr:hypothetical protein BUALT_Bualt06G0009800 [Buddleja alternifolia]
MNPPPPPPPSSFAATFFQSHRPNPPPPPPSLAAALSNLASLLHLCTTTLHSLPTPTPTTTTLLPCPFNPNHLIPPSSLFSHYLNCPSPLSLPLSLHYPLTLNSSAATAPPSFATSSDLSVSLDNYVSYNNNFFYQNCPGPVTPSVHPPPLLNLPTNLYMECADFNKDPSVGEALGFSVNFIRFLPSEVWAIRSETEAWGGGCPTVYSSRILRAILRLRDCKLLHLYEWIVASSPRYGIIIDFAMRDHVVLLVRLCLKAIVRETYGLAGVNFSDGESKMEENLFLRLSNQSFECPILVKVVMWLALQFSILYGEVNGKFLAVDVLKECIIDSASHASLLPLEQENAESNEVDKVDSKAGGPVQSVVLMEDNEKDERENMKDQTVGNSMIYISQVAAAVAALHERSTIEEKIKALRNPRPLSAYQRNMEHAYVSKIADAERQKRSDYRPIIEHDGLLWKRSNSQDTNKLKTREELLAEERDYKRRRMSYRGKKLKGNTLEVMRNIIDEYMEEIKLAGGIGGMSKAVEETEPLASENFYTNPGSTSVSGTKRNTEVSEENKDQAHDYRKQSNSRHDSKDIESHWNNGLRNSNRNVKRAPHDRDDYSRSREVRQSSSHSRDHLHGRGNSEYVEPFGEGSSNRSHKSRSESHERNHHKRNRDEPERNNHERERDQHKRTSRKKERYEDKRQDRDRGRSKSNSTRRERDEDDDRHRDRRRSKTIRSSSSQPELDEFEDRYDPAESHDFQ